MKEKIDSFKEMINGLMSIDENLVFSDFSCPIIWSDTNSSEFYKKFLYGNLEYDKKKILKRFFRSFFGYFYCYFSSLLFKRKRFIGRLKRDTEVLVVSWFRENNLKKDVYVGSIFDELEKKKRKVQFLLCPASEECMNKFIENENSVIINLKNKEVPGFFYVFVLYLKSKKFLRKMNFNFWERLMFYGNLFAPWFLKTIKLNNSFKELFSSNKRLKKCVIAWENQGWHKAIVNQLRKKGVETYGYIHSSMWPDQIYYSRLDNRYNKYLPKKVFVHGKSYFNILNEFGWNKKDLILIKSQRYSSLNKSNFFYGKLFLPFAYEEALFCVREAKKAVGRGIFSVAELDWHPILNVDGRLKKAMEGIPLNKKSKDIILCGTKTLSLEALSNKLKLFNVARDPEIQMTQLGNFEGIKTEKIGKHLFKTKMIKSPKNEFFIFDKKYKKMIDWL